jgi:hypothetical protein
VDYTASQVAKLVDAKLRTIQLWADFGILEPVGATQGAGTGVHRRFTITEVRVAALLMPFASIGVPRGVLKRAGDVFRDALLPSKHSGALRPATRDLRKASIRAISGTGHNALQYYVLSDIFTFQVVTDNDGRLVINPMRNDSLWNSRKSHVGVINLNAVLKGLEDFEGA